MMFETIPGGLCVFGSLEQHQNRKKNGKEDINLINRSFIKTYKDTRDVSMIAMITSKEGSPTSRARLAATTVQCWITLASINVPKETCTFKQDLSHLTC